MEKKNVFVGISGGVDSSVSAALLKKAGFDVTGVFIKIDVGGDCGWREERRDAMRVAAKLDIPFATLDLSKEYKKEVVEYMLGEYKAGRTPNPDVMCNKTIKFGHFYDRARKAGADFVATGHYSQIKKITNYELRMGEDKNKDQTYFLWTLTKDQLEHVLFPIGHLQKSEVRKLATKFGLNTAEKKDSQGLCFIGKIDVKDFLKGELGKKPGQVLDEKGEVIGGHDGALFLTIGERHGFTINAKTPHDKAYYVIGKDVKKNTITVSQNPKKALSESKEVTLEKTNWINGEPKEGKKYLARLRYRQPLQSCQMSKNKKGEWTATFSEVQTTITPGQSLVLYDKEVCSGGGVIK